MAVLRQPWGRAHAVFSAPLGPGALRRLPVAVNIVLVVLLASVAANLTWRVLTPPARPADGVPAAATAARAPAAQAADAQRLAGVHLFGTALQGPAPTAPIDAPETHLNLSLRGVFASRDPQEALAIISDPGGKEKPYRVGEALPGGATLHEIYADRVILSRGGRLEALRLQRERLPQGQGAQPAAVPSASAGEAPPEPPEPATRPDAAQRLRALRQEYAQDPKALWNQVRITPVMGDNGIKGYTLKHQDAGLMRAIGLRDDDVIVAVNGMPLSDPSVMYQVMNNLTTANQLSLTVERNGSPQTLNIDMQ